MKSFIINTARVVVSQKRKLDVTSKLLGREWRMLTDDPSISGKYIFLKEGKLLISVNGLSSYSTWQMATGSSIIMDEGVATFLYKVVHIDENIIVLNLDGTDSFCFLINDASQSLANSSLEDIQWYLFRHCNIDILSEGQKRIHREKINTKRQSNDSIGYRNDLRTSDDNNENDKILGFIAIAVGIIFIVVLYSVIVFG